MKTTFLLTVLLYAGINFLSQVPLKVQNRPQSFFNSDHTSVSFLGDSISYGQSIGLILETSTDEDTISFVGNVGDSLFLLMSGGTPRLDPEVELIDPNGLTLEIAQGAATAIIQRGLTTSGIYTILMREAALSDTGPYAVFIQKLNGPVNTIPISYGQTILDTLEPSGDVSTYQFSAMAGEKILAFQTPNTPRLDALLELYSSEGVLLASTSDANSAILTFDITVSEVYTLIARGSIEGNSGAYGMFLQRLNNPVGTIPLSYGETIQGSLTPGGDVDTYTFNGLADEHIISVLTPTVPRLDAVIDLYDSQGNLLISAADPNEAIIRYELSSNDTYTLLARGSIQGEIGEYGIHLQSLNNPVGTTLIDYGQTLAGILNPRGDVDSYIFNGKKDEVIFAMKTGVPPRMDPILELYDSQGNLLESSTSASEAIIRFELPFDDTYLLLARESVEGEPGSYGMHLQRLTNPVGSISISNGQTLNDSIRLPGDASLFTYSGFEGQEVEITVTENNTLEPSIELYDENGTLLSSALGNNSVTLADTLSYSGFFHVVVYDVDRGDIGDFDISLNSNCLISNVQVVKNPCSESGTYKLVLDVDYTSAPDSGKLEVIVNGQSYKKNYDPNASTKRIRIDHLPADGLPVDIIIRFTEDSSCTYSLLNALTAPTNCGPPLCKILDIKNPKVILKINGKYDLKLNITHLYAPSVGALDVEIDGEIYSFPIEPSPQKVKIKNLIPDGLPKDVRASFSTDSNCFLEKDSLFLAGCVSMNRLGQSIYIGKETLTAPTVYPVPSENHIFIAWPKSHSDLINIKILDLKGNVVYESKTQIDGTKKVSMAEFAVGMYILNIDDGFEKHVFKLFKK